MIKVGIWFDAPKNYFGNKLFQNLLYALSKHNPKEVKVYIFLVPTCLKKHWSFLDLMRKLSKQVYYTDILFYGF